MWGNCIFNVEMQTYPRVSVIDKQPYKEENLDSQTKGHKKHSMRVVSPVTRLQRGVSIELSVQYLS